MAKAASDSPLWDWASVARWLFLKNIQRAAAVLAQAFRKANEAIGCAEPHLNARPKNRDHEYESRL